MRKKRNDRRGNHEIIGELCSKVSCQHTSTPPPDLFQIRSSNRVLVRLRGSGDNGQLLPFLFVGYPRTIPRVRFSLKIVRDPVAD
ncbi:hypothetical protein PM082_013825 [Marasmius tenuissimus]|nr:hypothetical protein PM082_013825 [Marasmius tenuissimus]